MQKNRDIPSQLPAKQPLDTSWIQTNEIPAIRPGVSTWNQVQQHHRAPVTPIPQSWHDELPKSNHQRNLPVYREPIDLEKIGARITWLAIGIFGFVVMMLCMGKIIMMVAALK